MMQDISIGSVWRFNFKLKSEPFILPSVLFRGYVTSVGPYAHQIHTVFALMGQLMHYHGDSIPFLWPLKWYIVAE